MSDAAPAPLSPAGGPDPAPPLAFAQVREDPGVELALVRALARDPARAGRPLRVLVVGSGGCTALALAAEPAVGAIDAVDASPAQLRWIELRRAATATLAPDALARLAGVLPAPAAWRRAAWQALRPAVSPATRAFWDARPDALEAGLVDGGRFERLFADLRQDLRAGGVDLARRDPGAPSRPAWACAFARVFERERLAATFGRAAVDYSMSRGFDLHFAAVVAEAWRRYAPGTNPWLEQVVAGRYPADPAAWPPCWRPETVARARALGLERLRLHEGALGAALPALAATGPYDLVQTSNVTDWLPPADLRALVAAAAAALAPGGVLVARRLNGDHDLAALVGEVLGVDPAACRDLARRERAFFYAEVVVGRRGAAGP